MKKYSIDYIRAEFEKDGYTLLTEEYINSNTPISFTCLNNHVHKISFSCWNNWKQGYRCKYCAKNVRHTLEFVKASFEKESYILLSTEYKNQKQKLNYICSQGHNNSMTWTDWYNGEYRCPTCYFIRNSGTGNYGWQGGISYEPYCPVWKDKEYRDDIKERDGNKCLNPYCDYINSNDLTIHHIDYDKKNCSPKNLVTICRVCNTKANRDRDWHTAWYQALMYVRYNYKY